MKTNLKKICTLLIASQRMLETYLKGKATCSPFEAFNRSISKLYDFGDFNKLFSFGEFRDLLYNTVILNAPLPDCVLETITNYLKHYTMDMETDTISYDSAISEIKEEIIHFMLEENLKNYHRTKNEIETASIRQLIFAHQHNFNAYSAVRPLITWAENHNRLNYDFIYKMFEYGYIMGKRAERQKRAGQE